MMMSHSLTICTAHPSILISINSQQISTTVELTIIVNMPSWDNKPSGTMTAVVLSSPGVHPPSKCFTIDKQYPRPTLPSQTWVLVKVKAAGLNRAELRGRNGDEPAPPEFGMFVDEFHPDPPKILGRFLFETLVSYGILLILYTRRRIRRYS
jgi:hypothetical protein